MSGIYFSTQIVFKYKRDHGHRGLVALDDISFSRECIFDPNNSKLPDISPTSGPTTGPDNPCQVIRHVQNKKINLLK